MFAFVVAARDERQRRLRVRGRRKRQDSARGIVLWQSGGNAAHAPRAAEIQAIQMNKLWIGAVGYDRRLQK